MKKLEIREKASELIKVTSMVDSSVWEQFVDLAQRNGLKLRFALTQAIKLWIAHSTEKHDG